MERISGGAAAGHMVVGTPTHMAPEIALGMEHTAACDVWSLACTVIEMLTGTPPWDHGSGTAMACCVAGMVNRGRDRRGGRFQGRFQGRFEGNALLAVYRPKLFMKYPKIRPCSADVDPFALIHLLRNVGRGRVPPPQLPDDLSAVGQAFLTLCFAVEGSERPTSRVLAGHEWLAHAANYEESSRGGGSSLGAGPVVAVSTSPGVTMGGSSTLFPTGGEGLADTLATVVASSSLGGVTPAASESVLSAPAAAPASGGAVVASTSERVESLLIPYADLAVAPDSPPLGRGSEGTVVRASFFGAKVALKVGSVV